MVIGKYTKLIFLFAYLFYANTVLLIKIKKCLYKLMPMEISISIVVEKIPDKNKS